MYHFMLVLLDVFWIIGDSSSPKYRSSSKISSSDNGSMFVNVSLSSSASSPSLSSFSLESKEMCRAIFPLSNIALREFTCPRKQDISISLCCMVSSFNRKSFFKCSISSFLISTFSKINKYAIK